MEDIRTKGRVLEDSIKHITEDAVKGGRFFPANSILMSTTATIGEHALVTVPHMANQQFTSLTLRTHYTQHLDIKFLFYYCFILGTWCRANATMSSLARVDMKGFRYFPIPLPPLSEQERIVSVLDRFDRLVNDLREGLPGEIAARRKQYEYYRDRLLTFEVRDGS